jgi:hypothetical protein
MVPMLSIFRQMSRQDYTINSLPKAPTIGMPHSLLKPEAERVPEFGKLPGGGHPLQHDSWRTSSSLPGLVGCYL